MPFAETALGIGALLGGAASGGSAIASGSMNRKNRKWQEKMYNLQVTQRREEKGRESGHNGCNQSPEFFGLQQGEKFRH